VANLCATDGTSPAAATNALSTSIPSITARLQFVTDHTPLHVGELTNNLPTAKRHNRKRKTKLSKGAMGNIFYRFANAGLGEREVMRVSR
jgi:hypothetical protein